MELIVASRNQILGQSPNSQSPQSMPVILKNRARNAYSFANINLLGECNLGCFYCLGKDIAKTISGISHLNIPVSELPNFDAFVRACHTNEIKTIYVTGLNTDPLLYQDLESMITYLQDGHGFKVGLRTNGLLARKSIDVINKCHGGFSTNIFSPYPEKYAEITGRRTFPDYDFIFNNVKAPQRVASVISAYNKDDFFEMVEFVSKYPQIRYFQARCISTDTRLELLSEHLVAFDDLLLKTSQSFEKIGEFEKAPVFDIYGVKTVFWKTVETNVNSINYFSNGTISMDYFIIEGYLNAISCR